MRIVMREALVKRDINLVRAGGAKNSGIHKLPQSPRLP